MAGARRLTERVTHMRMCMYHVDMVHAHVHVTHMRMCMYHVATWYMRMYTLVWLGEAASWPTTFEFLTAVFCA